jgi:hypothetical protein
MSSLEERYLKRKSEKLNEEKIRIDSKKELLANKIRKIFEDPETIKAIENKLVEYGSVTLKQTPCTCEDGGCSDTKGFKEYLKDIIDEWDKKGVLIDFSINQTFYLKSVNFDRAFVRSRLQIKSKDG